MKKLMLKIVCSIFTIFIAFIILFSTKVKANLDTNELSNVFQVKKESLFLDKDFEILGASYPLNLNDISSNPKTLVSGKTGTLTIEVGYPKNFSLTGTSCRIYNNKNVDVTSLFPNGSWVKDESTKSRAFLTIAIPASTPVDNYRIVFYYNSTYQFTAEFMVVKTSNDYGSVLKGNISDNGFSTLPQKLVSNMAGNVYWNIYLYNSANPLFVTTKILKDGIDVTNRFRVNAYILSSTSLRYSVDISPGTSVGTYSMQIYYGQELKFTKTFTIYSGVINVTSITLNRDTIELMQTQTATLSATVSPSDATNKKIIWSSNNNGIVTVDSNGKITAVSPGTAYITVQAEDNEFMIARCKVTVLTPNIIIESAKYDPEKIYSNTGGTVTYPFTTTNIVAGRKLDLVIKKDNVVVTNLFQITENVIGSSSGIKIKVPKDTAPGKYTVEISFDGLLAKTTVFLIYESEYSTSITLNKDRLNLEIGQISKLVATVSPENVTERDLSWYSSNENVARVDEYGNVTAINNGETTITVRDQKSGKTATCIVTVNKSVILVTGITLNKSSHTLLVSEIYTLNFTISPSNATNRNISWTSSNQNVATVDKNGKITAISNGTTVITVTTEDGKFTATCLITVNTKADPNVPSITSNTYEIDGINGIIILPQMQTVSDFLKHVSITNGAEEIYNQNGNLINKNDIIGTGMIIKIGNLTTYTFLIYGDLDGNGKIDIVDLSKLKLHLLEIHTLEGIYREACNLNRDNAINVVDLSKLKLLLLGINP